MDYEQDVNMLPIKGVTAATEVEPDGPEPQPMQESTITDMASDGYVFFTPALITTHGLLDVDPAIEFNKTHDTNDDSERLFYIDCQYPFFSGLGTGVLNDHLVDWDRRIYGIHGENWEPCRNFFSAISGYDAKAYHYFRVGMHELSIVDPTAFYDSVGVQSELPMLDLTVFCIPTNRNFAWIAPAKEPPSDLPRLIVDPPPEWIHAEAEAILGPPADAKKIIEPGKG